jgi:Holliday junction resolvasome RuvABC endonuclease subunit
MTVLGIDPGSVSGAWAVIYDNGEMSCGDLPVVDRTIDPAAFARLVRALGPCRAVVEQVAAMPKQGVSSTFAFGRGFGCILGVLGACEVPITMVTPGKWKRTFGLDSDKEKSRALAIRTWPASAQFARKKDAGRAEAALIARWGSMA